jgi:ketosteroid isomerase-like protein
MGHALNPGRPLVFAMLAAVAAACTIERGDVRTPSGQPPEADSVAVRLAMEAVALAYESGDMSAFDTLYHESLTVVEGEQVISGRASYVADDLAPQIRSLDDRDCRLYDVRVRLARNTAWATYRFDLAGTRDGERVDTRGVGTMILQKFQGRWQIVHVHTSAVEEDVER